MATNDEDENLMGYATRRNGSSCAVGETTGVTMSGQIQLCCPKNTTTPDGNLNICCPSTETCIGALRDKARCAEHTANLYFIEPTERHFCCSNDTQGFRNASGNGAGCVPADDKEALRGVEFLPILDQYTISASTNSNTATATTSSSTTTAVTNNDDTTQNNTGAIAGGVVGGIAGVTILIALAWFFLRPRKKQAEDSQPIQRTPATISDLSDSTRVAELSGSNQITELSGQSISELPGSGKQNLPPVELV